MVTNTLNLARYAIKCKTLLGVNLDGANTKARAVAIYCLTIDFECGLGIVECWALGRQREGLAIVSC